MIPVRFIWPKVQRDVKFASTTPARDFKLREEHDHSMLKWASGRAVGRGDTEPPMILIAGHTHKPVFFERAPELGGPVGDDAPVRPSVDQAKAAYDEAVADTSISASERARRHIEIDGGEIRLVRWLDNNGEPEVHALSPSEPLRDVFTSVGNARGG